MTDAEKAEQGIHPFGPRWSDEEIATFQRRFARLRKGFGINDLESEQLAERMLYRDRPDSGDDRRICAECKSLVGKNCKENITMVRTILWRCDKFAMRGAA